MSPQRMTDKCFRKCIGKPGGSLDNSEQVRPLGPAWVLGSDWLGAFARARMKGAGRGAAARAQSTARREGRGLGKP